jgi:hypothetical protein
MKSDKKKGKRGRPKKLVLKISTPVEETVDGESNIEIIAPEIKRKRGRPAKLSTQVSDKVVKEKDLPAVEEEYIQPKILRRKRVFRFDKRVFHQFAKKYNGDIVIMSFR